MSAPDPQQPITRTAPTNTPAAAPNSDQATVRPTPIEPTPDRSSNRRAKRLPAPITLSRGGTSPDQPKIAATPIVASAGRPDSQQPIATPTPREATAAAPDSQEQRDHIPTAAQRTSAPLLWDPVLHMLAAGLDDIEQTRIAQEHRYRILTTTKPDSDGRTRGFGLDDSHPSVAAIKTQIETLKFLDKQMAKALQKQLRAHPLHPWIKAQKGLGAKTIARLFGAIRDPYWHDGIHSDGEPLNRPRTLGELFAFCGVAGPGQRRMRGVKTTWSPDARKRLFIIADTIVKVGGPYRLVYDAGREKYTDKTHTEACAQCGKKGQPAPVGSDWRDGHKHAAARRLVMRAVLRDLWEESRAYYERQEASA